MTKVMDFHVRLAPRPGARDRLLSTLDECGLERAVVCAGGTIDLDRLSRQLILGGHVQTDADNDAVLSACNGTDGRLVPFAKLVFATGSQPLRLNVPGSDLPGVHTFRDSRDVDLLLD